MLIPVHNCDFLIFHAIAEPHFLPSGLRAVIVRVYLGHLPGFRILYRSIVSHLYECIQRFRGYPSNNGNGCSHQVGLPGDESA